MKRETKVFLSFVGTLVLLFLTFVVTLWFVFAPESWHHRKARFEKAAENGKLVVNAIRSYESSHGEPPPSLEALIPVYLRSIPLTGLRDYPAFEYLVFTNSKSPWELRIECSKGVLNWDVFFYWPTQDYPQNIYGGSTERIGEWAYVHE